MSVKVLLIDDDVSLSTATKMFLETKDCNCCVKNSFSDGETALLEESFDIVITDYKDNHNNVDNAGEIIMNKLKLIRFSPLIIYTGFLGNIDDEVIKKQNSFFKIIEKDEGSDSLLLLKINEIITSKEYKIKNDIEKEIDSALKENFKEYFWDIIHNHWDDFKDLNEDSLKAILFRKILKDLYPKKIENENINPIEFYEHPVKNLEISSGAIISKDGSFFVCVNNDCDLSINITNSGIPFCKASKISMLEIIDYNSILCSTGTPDNQKVCNNRLLNNNDSKYREKSFFFPKTFFFRGGYVNFYDIATKELIIENNKIKLDDIGVVVAKVHAPFLQSFISNFSRCYNRFGTPTIDMF